MSIRSITFFVISILLFLCFWESQTCLILCKTTSITQSLANDTQSLANDTQEGFQLTKTNFTKTQEDSILRKWNTKDSKSTKSNSNDKQNSSKSITQKADVVSTLINGNPKLTQEGSTLTEWEWTDHEIQKKSTLYSNIHNKIDLPMASNFSFEGGSKTFKLSEIYGRMLTTTYTKDSVGWWWPRISMKEEEVSLNISCPTCNITSNVVRKKKSKSLLSQLYEKLFVMTHARLHPMHHRPVRVIIVDQSGHGHSHTVQGAIDMVRLDNKWRIQIIIRPGIYREKVYVPYRKPFITFQGSGSANTLITWNAKAGDRNQGGEILGTFDSASVAIDSDYFVARDITFQNTSPPPLPGAQGMQAVALRISGDKAAFIDCRMLGAQDTLFDHVGRHFFLRCYIEGAIDFIFGDGRSLYLNCELHANAVTYGAVAASQRNSPNDNTGFSFVQCKITGTGLLYLGRAWGQYARILFAFSYFENIIIPDGWYDWGDTSRRETVFFGEYKCWGPGSQVRWRVSWSRQLSYQEARPFLSIGFINGHKWFNILT